MKPNQKTVLDAISDKVLSYRPKPKSAPARSRKRRKAKLARSFIAYCDKRLGVDIPWIRGRKRMSEVV